MPIAPQLVAEINAHLPGAVRRGDAPLLHGSGERLATGCAALDAALDGGLPRGRLSELCGATTAGLTSLVHRLLAHVTAQAHVAAWIDAPDAFDPASAVAAGVDLERLLWIRPPDLATAFTAAEAVLGMGGFPLVLLDASVPRDVDAERARSRDADAGAHRVTTYEPVVHGARSYARRQRRMADAQHVWMRLARAAARSRCALVVLQRTPRKRAAAAPGAGFAAAVRLEIEPLRVVWDRAGGAPTLLDGLVTRIVVVRNRGAHEPSRQVVLEIV